MILNQVVLSLIKRQGHGMTLNLIAFALFLSSMATMARSRVPTTSEGDVGQSGTSKPGLFPSSNALLLGTRRKRPDDDESNSPRNPRPESPEALLSQVACQLFYTTIRNVGLSLTLTVSRHKREVLAVLSMCAVLRK